jgi:PAS domain S-box-containing protein
MESGKPALILIGIGAFFILLSALKTSRMLGLLKENPKEFNLWRILFFLMIFFFAGYLASLFFILRDLGEILILITGLVFCLGGLFVYIVTRVSSFTINDLLLKNKCEDLNKDLKSSLKQLEEYKHFFYNSHDFSCIANYEGFFETLNKRWETGLGYSKKELMEKKFTEFVHPDDIELTLREIEKLKPGLVSSHFINRYRKKNGDYLWFDWITTSDKESGKYFATARDITSRIQMEKQLEKSEIKFRKMIEEIYDGVYTCDAKGFFTYVNSGCAKITGYSEKELIGKHFLELIIPDQKKDALEFYKHQFINRTSETLYSFQITTKAGTKKWVEQTVSVLSENDWVNGFQCIVRDITERKKAEFELEEKSKNLKRSNEELEQFAYVTTHDLQEPLRTIANFVTLFRQKYAENLDEETEKYLKYIVNATETMQTLIKELLGFSRIGKNVSFDFVDCNNIVQEVLEGMHDTISVSNAKINVSELPKLKGNEMELKRLFQNLISNAVKFIRKDTFPEISITCEQKKNKYVFAVKDNGIGIEEQYYDRIFIIFQRLHNVTEYSGTGIGLATCKKIVEMHGGKIWVKSKPNEGSTFYFSIPKIINQ